MSKDYKMVEPISHYCPACKCHLREFGYDIITENINADSPLGKEYVYNIKFKCNRCGAMWHHKNESEE